MTLGIYTIPVLIFVTSHVGAPTALSHTRSTVPHTGIKFTRPRHRTLPINSVRPIFRPRPHYTDTTLRRKQNCYSSVTEIYLKYKLFVFHTDGLNDVLLLLLHYL